MLLNELMSCRKTVAESGDLGVLNFSQIIILVTLGKSFNFSEPLFIKWTTGSFKAEGETHEPMYFLESIQYPEIQGNVCLSS